MLLEFSGGAVVSFIVLVGCGISFAQFHPVFFSLMGRTLSGSGAFRNWLLSFRNWVVGSEIG